MRDLELQARWASWLHNRLYQDRVRIMNPRTRARAFLATSVEFVGRVKSTEARDPGVRAQFFDLLEQVERIAQGLPIYEYVDGVGYVGKHGAEDERLRRISKAAAMAGMSVRELDEAACVMARLEDAALDEGEALVTALRSSAGSPRPRPRSSHLRCVTAPEPKRSVKPANYDDTRLREISRMLPDQVSWRERTELADMLLGDLDSDMDASEDIKPLRARADASLVASLKILVNAERGLERAVAEKARRLSKEYPAADGTERDYLCRAADLDAELVQDARELLVSLRAALVSCAVKLSSIKRWPGNRTSPKHVRARALAMAVAKSRTFSSAELDMATASLGHGIGVVT